MKPTSLTLARRGRQAYQVTYWDDGVARWDGAETETAWGMAGAHPKRLVSPSRTVRPLAQELRPPHVQVKRPL